MQILGLLGIYFDAVVVEGKTFLLLFRLAQAILTPYSIHFMQFMHAYICLSEMETSVSQYDVNR